jgi:hypothetical protein
LWRRKRETGHRPDIGLVGWNVQGGGGTADRLYMIEGCSFYIFMSRSMCILFRGEFGKYIVEGKDKEDINLAISGGIER